MIRGRETRIVLGGPEVDAAKTVERRFGRISLAVSIVTLILFLFQSIVMWINLKTPVEAVLFSERVQYCRGIQKKLTKLNVIESRLNNSSSVDKENTQKAISDIVGILQFDTAKSISEYAKLADEIIDAFIGSEIIFEEDFNEILRNISMRTGKDIGFASDDRLFYGVGVESQLNLIRLLLREVCR